MLEISFDASDEHAYCSPVRVTKTDNFTDFPKLEETLNDKTNEMTGKMEKISEKEEKEEKVIHTFTYPAKLDSGFEPNYELD